jgi:hypothetical protein
MRTMGKLPYGVCLLFESIQIQYVSLLRFCPSHILSQS